MSSQVAPHILTKLENSVVQQNARYKAKDINTLTITELQKLLEQQVALYNDTALISSLPDKGKKIHDKIEQIKYRIQMQIS